MKPPDDENDVFGDCKGAPLPMLPAAPVKEPTTPLAAFAKLSIVFFTAPLTLLFAPPSPLPPPLSA
jgi:hypothetical protein